VGASVESLASLIETPRSYSWFARSFEVACGIVASQIRKADEKGKIAKPGSDRASLPHRQFGHNRIAEFVKVDQNPGVAQIASANHPVGTVDFRLMDRESIPALRTLIHRMQWLFAGGGFPIEQADSIKSGHYRNPTREMEQVVSLFRKSEPCIFNAKTLVIGQYSFEYQKIE
jgi:hypothetical protein